MKTEIRGKIKQLKAEENKLERQLKWLKDRADAIYFYKNSEMNVGQIARLLKLSATTVHHMIDGKNLPKWFEDMKNKATIITIEKGKVKVKLSIEESASKTETQEKIQTLINSIGFFEMRAKEVRK